MESGPFEEKMNNFNKFSLKWDDFSESLSLTISEEKALNDFTDVTLVCEDGTQIEAHRLVLAGGSKLFNSLLRLKKGPNSSMYLRGLKSKDLTAIVDFLYHGEIKIDQDNLHDFLEIAEEFQLKGLIGVKEDFGNQSAIKENHVVNKYLAEKKSKEQQLVTDKEQYYIPNPSLIKLEFEDYVAVEPTDLVNVNEMENLEQKIKDMLDTTSAIWKCTVCGKNASAAKDGRRNLKRHIQTHTEGLTYTCNICGKAYRYKQSQKNVYICHILFAGPNIFSISTVVTPYRKNVLQQNKQNKQKMT